ncbi:MAG TPA: RDD family protein [Bryobacteraceae bacterium]|jgi:uncharacterized RDD family membrane protein YckC|nr:RDD family protein [Bryobacteraceae bacterium]
MKSEIQVPTGLTTEGLLGRRYFARLLDSIAIVAVLAVVGVVWSTVVSARAGVAPNLIFILLLCVSWIAYGTILEASKAQATLGKRLLGLRVYNSQGGRLSITQAAGRNLLKDGPFLLLGLIPGSQLLALGWLVVHLIVIHRSPVNQAIHDRVAHTWVASPEETIQLRIV